MSPRSSALTLLLLLVPLPALSHAALLQAEAAQAVRLQAVYDTGAPMAGAQVVIYAPGNPVEPWGRGETDAEGRYVFLPDTAEGRWTVQVRQAGHGAIAHVEMTGGAPVALAGGTGADWLQRAVMIALVGWGALGTALFALRGRKQGRGQKAARDRADASS